MNNNTLLVFLNRKSLNFTKFFYFQDKMHPALMCNIL